jgi:hypothetical protein
MRKRHFEIVLGTDAALIVGIILDTMRLGSLSCWIARVKSNGICRGIDMHKENRVDGATWQHQVRWWGINDVPFPFPSGTNERTNERMGGSL